MTTVRDMIPIMIMACLVSNGFAAPLQFDTLNALFPQSSQNNYFQGATETLINEVVTGLRKSSQTASDSVAIFTTALVDQTNLFNNHLHKEIVKMDIELQEAVNHAQIKINQLTTDLIPCLENGRESAEALFNSTALDIGACVTDTLDEFSSNFIELESLATQAASAADDAYQRKTDCMARRNVFKVATCLAGVLVDVQANGLSIGVQIGVEISNIASAFTSIPKTISMCAANRLAEAGFSVAKIAVQLSDCTVDAVMAP